MIASQTRCGTAASTGARRSLALTEQTNAPGDNCQGRFAVYSLKLIFAMLSASTLSGTPCP